MNERHRADASRTPPRAAWNALLEQSHIGSTAALVLCTVSPAFGYFVTATVLPSVVEDIGGLALYASLFGVFALSPLAALAIAARLARGDDTDRRGRSAGRSTARDA